MARWQSTIDTLGNTSSRGRTVNLERISRFVQFTSLFVQSVRARSSSRGRTIKYTLGSAHNTSSRGKISRLEATRLHEGRLNWLESDVLTREDGQSRADLEIRTVHDSVCSIGASKIVLTREDGQPRADLEVSIVSSSKSLR